MALYCDTLDLQGAYLQDAPLVLPSLFVLRLNGSIVDAKNITNVYLMVFRTGFRQQYTILGVIEVLWNATAHSTIPRMQAVSLLNGEALVAKSPFKLESAIGIKGEQNEISYCDTGGTNVYPTLVQSIISNCKWLCPQLLRTSLFDTRIRF